MRLANPSTGVTALFGAADLGHIVGVPQTVLIVDDHPGFRQAARALLEADGFKVIGESATGTEGLADAHRLRPDLVLLDVCLPDVDGIEVAGRLRGGPAVVLTSSRDASDYPPHFENCGARGFIAKAELSGQALAALAA
ncbi:MAG TPA: response regulator transcription factor [Solirubrobacter sp.]|nr:response regulator transcription factor [Solirubrobacter sp.]